MSNGASQIESADAQPEPSGAAAECSEGAQASSSKRGLLRQAFKYVGVGGASALLELALFQGLVWAHIALVPANVVAVVCATAFNFIANRNVTFKSSANPIRSLVLYLLLFAFNTAFSSAAIVWLTGLGLAPLLAKIVAMACIVCWNFFLYRHVVFK